MRDYWTDFMGRRWPLVTSRRRLKFRCPAHAALRAHVFHRDAYACVRCGVAAEYVPEGYDGHSTLASAQVFPSGYQVLLVVDHVLTLKAGGKNSIENFQTLCEVCNRRKQVEDNSAAYAYRDGGL